MIPTPNTLLYIACKYPILLVIAVISGGIYYAPSEVSQAVLENNTTTFQVADCCSDAPLINGTADLSNCTCDNTRIISQEELKRSEVPVIFKTK